MTFFVDIDGVVFKHHGFGMMGQMKGAVEGLALTHSTLNRLEGEGHHIVLVTARPEHLRESTLAALHSCGFVFHQLVMGITSGTRVLVNDDKPGGPVTAMAISVVRNAGWSGETERT